MHSIRILDAASNEWDQWLEAANHDFYQLRQYHLCAQENGEGRAFLAVSGSAEQFVAWPYLLRDIPGESTLKDVCSAYGYPGPVCSRGLRDAAVIENAWKEIVAAWRFQNAVSAFTRFHPLIENSEWLMRTSASLGIRSNGETVSLDLECSDDERRRAYQRILRQEINSARQLGVTTEVDESWSRLDEFVVLYHQTMERNKAAGSYFFPIEYFRELKAALGSHAHLMVTTFQGQLALACVFIEYAGTLHAHLEGADHRFMHLSPFKVMVDDVSRWARERGNRALHLGGGRGGRNDSLFAFKARFSKRRHQFRTGRWVIDDAAYAGLCEARKAEASQSAMEYAPGEFFPAYRAPLQSVAPLSQHFNLPETLSRDSASGQCEEV